MVYANVASSYRGLWKDDLYHGKGILQTEKMIIECTFEQGVPKGGSQARIQYLNGEVFEGNLNHYYRRDGKNGRYNYLNGDKYVGEWTDDKRDGRGVI